MAKPRVFVSSTYYDLKYLRSSLEHFIESLGFEPILSEKGDIAYSHDKPTDESCYMEVSNSDILVLIIGGRYGSQSSRGKEKSSNDFPTDYDSITREEFKTAIENQIPAYILIEKSVFSDYETYLRNKDNRTINYAHVDSTNIFNFIEEILALPQNNPVHQFDRYSEIEIWLKEQWAGKFRELLKTTTQKEQLLNLSNQVGALSEINGSMKRYLEQIVTTVIPEQSEELIEKEKHIQSFNIITHISNLKDMVRLWLQNLSSNKVAPAEETFTYARLNPFAPSLRDIENQVLFEDIFHHFPDLRDFWNESKTLDISYSLERQGFFDKIEKFIKHKLKECNFDYESETDNWGIESKIVRGFALSVYIEIIRKTKGKNNLFDYISQKVNVKDVEKTKLFYEFMGSENGYNLAYVEPEKTDEVRKSAHL